MISSSPGLSSSSPRLSSRSRGPRAGDRAWSSRIDGRRCLPNSEGGFEGSYASRSEAVDNGWGMGGRHGCLLGISGPFVYVDVIGSFPPLLSLKPRSLELEWEWRGGTPNCIESGFRLWVRPRGTANCLKPGSWFLVGRLDSAVDDCELCCDSIEDVWALTREENVVLLVIESGERNPSLVWEGLVGTFPLVNVTSDSAGGQIALFLLSLFEKRGLTMLWWWYSSYTGVLGPPGVWLSASLSSKSSSHILKSPSRTSRWLFGSARLSSLIRLNWKITSYRRLHLVIIQWALSSQLGAENKAAHTSINAPMMAVHSSMRDRWSRWTRWRIHPAFKIFT